MRKRETPLEVEVEELLEKVLLEEATEAVWQVFEEALSKVNDPKLSFLKEHFSGISNSDLSKKSGLSEKELSKILKHSKDEIIELMRREKPTRQ